jgi:hypothetical protein
VSAGGPKSLEQERRAVAQRLANARAVAEGRPLPHPNVWDRLDPTKVAPGATPEEIQASHDAFRGLCRPRARKRHRLQSLVRRDPGRRRAHRPRALGRSLRRHPGGREGSDAAATPLSHFHHLAAELRRV